MTTKDSALVVVDMLYDFIDGTLACKNAQEAVDEALSLILEVRGSEEGEDDCGIFGGFPVLFVRDSHPADHSSFSEFGGTWPSHCVKGTRGAQIHEKLKDYASEELTFYKGCDKAQEQYSGFDGRNSAGQSLGEILELLDIKTVHVCGIATEYCVRNTAEDLLKAGFEVVLHSAALAYVDYDGHVKALEEMKAENITVI